LILDDFLRQDPASRVACETFVSTGLAVVGGEVTSHAYVDIQGVVRRTIRHIGYTKGEYHFDADSCAVISAVHEQSPDIAQGVDRAEKEEQGAGDQGMMFGYACNETPDFMPLPLTLAHVTLLELARIRREDNSPMPYLRPDAKCQYTVEYKDDHTPNRIHTLVLSTQHDPDADQARIRKDVEQVLLPRVKARLSAANAALFQEGMILHVNPTGQFIIGGPHGDTGLTGRKIIVDTYGGRGAHGGGAFSGKDPSKVDRSAAYAARYIAKNLVAAGVADEMLVQISYAIGVARPVSIYVNTYGTAHVAWNDGAIAEKINSLFDLRPAAIIDHFGLTNPIYRPTAAYGHMGRDPYVEEVELIRDGRTVRRKVQFFGWELLDAVDRCRAAFQL
jgi:S-adenosylmethionine synthetase